MEPLSLKGFAKNFKSLCQTAKIPIKDALEGCKITPEGISRMAKPEKYQKFRAPYYWELAIIHENLSKHIDGLEIQHLIYGRNCDVVCVDRTEWKEMAMSLKSKADELINRIEQKGG